MVKVGLIVYEYEFFENTNVKNDTSFKHVNW